MTIGNRSRGPPQALVDWASMGYLPRRDSVAAWLFFGLGLFLLRWRFLVASLVHRSQDQFGFVLAPAAVLFLITGWGLRHKQPWARWTGIIPCVCLLWGWPYLTGAGALALCVLFRQPYGTPEPAKAD